jgi:hypothetical protein
MNTRLIRCVVCSILSIGLASRVASAQAAGALTGTYTGTYRYACGQGVTSLKLTLVSTPGGSVFGTFTLYLPPGTQKDAYTYSLQGAINPGTLKFTLTPVKWETAAPANVPMLGVNGTFDSNELAGMLTGGNTRCTTFDVERTSAAPAAVPSSTVSRAPVPAPAQGAPQPPVTGAAGVQPSAIPASPSQPSQAPTGRVPDDRRSELTAPVVKWRPDTSNPQTVLQAAPIFVEPQASVLVEAVCGPNGASVNFRVYDRKGETGPQFDHHVDPSPAGAKSDIVDIEVSIDGKKHVAKGFLAIDDRNQFVNNVGVLFYEPGLAVKAKGERQFAGRIGAAVDNITGGLIAADVAPEIEEGLRTSAGPLSDLVKSSSIQMRVPVQGARTAATFELGPAMSPFREFAARCYSRFGGSATPKATPPTGTPSRTAPANPTPRRTTR